MSFAFFFCLHIGMSKTTIRCTVHLELMTKNEVDRQLWVKADWGEFELTPSRLEELKEIVGEGDRFFGDEEINFVKLAIRDDYEPPALSVPSVPSVPPSSPSPDLSASKLFI